MKVLVVDDEPQIRRALRTSLEAHGYEVATVGTGEEGVVASADQQPDLVLLDVMMPGMDGFELCARVKRIADLPIIVLSAVDASEAKVRALEDYAEDYITKPFDPDELAARIHRVLRRTAGRSRIVLGGGDLEIDLATRRLRIESLTHPLTPTEVRVLQVLIGSLDHTVPTETLLERVWSESDGADPSYVWVTVRRLRRKLEPDPDNPRYLLTDRGVGYRLVSVAQGVAASGS